MKFLVVVLVLAATVLHINAQSSFGIGIPTGPLNTQAQKVVPEIEAKLKAIQLPDHCCYDDVGKKHVHFNIIGPKIDQTATSATVTITSAGGGLTALFGGQVKENFFVRLCIHLNPFGHGCDTLYGCKGDVYATESGSGAVALKVCLPLF